MTRLRWLLALGELVLPRTCAGCGAPSTWWCDRCAPELLRSPVLVPLLDVDRCAGVAPYRGPAGAAIVAWKERGVVGVTDALADALAASVRLAAEPHSGRLALVPVPSRPAAVRSRGCDVVATLARTTAMRLRAEGIDAVAVPCLTHTRRVVDQTGLGPADRAMNLGGAMRMRAAGRRLLAGREVVVVDDVVTTGVTLAEATRTLRASVSECAPVAAVLTLAGPAADAAPVGTVRSSPDGLVPATGDD